VPGAGADPPRGSGGGQYASGASVARREEAGGRISRAAGGTPYPNAKAESFFPTLEHEEGYLKEDRTCAEAEGNLERFIEDGDNTKRWHSRLGYLPPVEVATTAPKTGEFPYAVVRS